MGNGIFVISSDHGADDSALYGYAYDGVDIILGDTGRRAFHERTGRELSFGEDGAYVLIRRAAGGFSIGTDVNGHGKIFLYTDKTYWALSNSFYELAKFLRAAGRPLTLDLTQLASFGIPSGFGAQLKSSHTLFHEIRLVPAHVELAVTSAGITARARPHLGDPADAPSDYEQAMRIFLRNWIGRMVTLLSSDSQISCDLSGGIDSRATLAMLLAAGRRVGNERLVGVYINSNKSMSVDYAVSRNLMQEIGLSNEGVENPVNRTKRGTEEAYDLWKSLYLGCYSLVYFPNTARNSHVFWVAGEGGESNRNFYGGENFAGFLNGMKKYFTEPDLAEDFIDVTRHDMEDLEHEVGSGIDLRILHYQSYRERFHGARRSTFLNSVAPLVGKDLKWAHHLAGAKRQADGQIIYDIMGNTAPDVLLTPFDVPKKKFGPDVLRGCLNLHDFASEVDMTGQVFRTPEEDEPTGSFSMKDAIALMLADYEASRDDAISTGVFSAARVEEADAMMRDAAAAGGFRAAVDGKGPAHILFAGVLKSLSSGSR